MAFVCLFSNIPEATLDSVFEAGVALRASGATAWTWLVALWWIVVVLGLAAPDPQPKPPTNALDI